jgi:biopolymer transport protein ExbD
MKAPVRPRDPGLRFNITPLVDICFNLIVFFALASLAMQKEAAELMELPRAGQSDASASSMPRRLVVTVNADRKLLLGGEEVSPNELERRLIEQGRQGAANIELRIRADRTVPFGDIKPMILACARNGITNLKFAVQKP